MIIKDIENTEEITIEDKTYIRVIKSEPTGCENCAFDNIWIGCNNCSCDNGFQIYILKPESDGTET